MSDVEVWHWNPELDRGHVVAMGQRFVEQTTTGAWMGEAATLEQIEGVVRQLEKHGTVFKATTYRDGIIGMLGVCLFTQPYTLEVQAEEMVFWVEPAHRRTQAAPLLLGAAEHWARQVGAAVLKMAAPPRSGFERWLTRNGYGVVEVSMAKALTPGADARIQSRVRSRRQRARGRQSNPGTPIGQPGQPHHPEGEEA